MNKLVPRTPTMSVTKRKSVSEGKANGFRRGLRLSVWEFVSIPCSCRVLQPVSKSTSIATMPPTSRRQTSRTMLRVGKREPANQRIGQQLGLRLRKLELASLDYRQLMHLPHLFRRQRH